MNKKYASIAGGLFLTAVLLVMVVFTSQMTSQRGNVTRVAPRASTSSGTVTARIDPATANPFVGSTFPLAIKINSGTTAISSMQVRITYPFTGATPPIAVVGDPVEGSSALQYITKTVTTTSNLVTIDIAAFASPSDYPNGYAPGGEFTLATLNMVANAPTSGTTLSFDQTYSKVIDKVSGLDNLSSTLPATVVTSSTDTTAPVVSITPTTDILQKTTSISYSWSATDNSGSLAANPYSYTMTGQSAVNNTSATSVTFNNLADGSYNFTVTAKDAAGNVGSASRTLTVDTSAPTTPTVTGTTGLINTSSANFSFSSTDSRAGAVITYATKLDSGSWSSYSTTATKSYTGLSEGTHTFLVQAKDDAENVSGQANRTFTVDTVAPTAPTITGPTGTINVNSANFTWSSTDSRPGAVVTYAYRLDAGSWSGFSSGTSYSWTSIPDGAHSFSVQAKDDVGNTSTVSTNNFTVSTATSMTVKFKYQGMAGVPQGGHVNYPIKTVRVRLYTQGSNPTVATEYKDLTATPDSNGVYTAAVSNPPTGTYDVYLKGWAHLQKNAGSVTIVAGTPTTKDASSVSLLAGDLAGSLIKPNDPDNMVDSSDLGILINDFAIGVQKVSASDLSGDGIVDADDLALLINNFKIGLYGDGGAE